MKIIDKIIKYNIDIVLVYIIINLYLLILLNGKNLKSLDYIISHPYSFFLIFANTLILSSIYLLNKLADKQEDAVNGTLVNTTSNFIFYYYIFANIISFLIYLSISPNLLIFFVLFLILGLFYSYPKKFRLKNIFILKNLVPAFCWYLSLVLLTYFNYKNYFSVNTILIGQLKLLISFLIFEILWDMPDLEGDKQAGVKTFPVVLGFLNTKIFLIIVNIFVLFIAPTISYKIICSFIIIFLFFSKINTPKKYYHMLIVFVSIIYLSFGFFTQASFIENNNIIDKYYKKLDLQRSEIKETQLSKDNENQLLNCGNDGKCFEKIFEKIAFYKGGEEAFRELTFFMNAHPDFNDVCHLSAHGIGHGSIKRNNFDFAKSLQEFDGTKYFGYGAICGSGYYHGMIEYLVQGLKTQKQISNKLKKLCENNYINSITGIACPHGVGHAAFIQLDNNLANSLRFCSDLESSTSDRYQCYSGVFMEATQDLPDNLIINYSNNKIDFPLCDSIFDPDQLSACYFGTSFLIRNFVKKIDGKVDFESAIKFCQQIDGTRNKVTCIRRLARDAVGEHYQKIKEMCIDSTKTQKERILCIVNVANLTAIALTNTKNDYYFKITSDICNYLSSSESKTCNAIISFDPSQNYSVTDDDIEIK